MKLPTITKALGLSILIVAGSAASSQAGVAICYDKNHPGDPAYSFTTTIHDSYESALAQIQSAANYDCQVASGRDAAEVKPEDTSTLGELAAETGVALNEVEDKLREWGYDGTGNLKPDGSTGTLISGSGTVGIGGGGGGFGGSGGGMGAGAFGG